MKTLSLLLLIFVFISGKQETDIRTKYFPRQELKATRIPARGEVWVFVLAGQSNMAGRGQVEPQDTIPSNRILTLNKKGEIIIAKEPLHFYEPTLTGLDCGLSFGKTLLKHVPDNVTILLIPTAVGGSSIKQWLGDSTFRNVQLLTNFKEKIGIAKKTGQLKAILWHQGESDANPKDIPLYSERLSALFALFRNVAGDKNLPVLVGELGSYSKNKEEWMKINEQINRYAATDHHVGVIHTADLVNRGDQVHFNSEGQRLLGERFANGFVSRKQ